MAYSDINFKPGSMYSFNVWPVAILGTSFANVTVLSTMTEEAARRRGEGTAEKHAQIYPLIPADKRPPDDPASYMYVEVKTLTGEITIIGMAAIDASSVVLIDSQTAIVTIGDVTSADVLIIRNILAQANYRNIEITLRNG